MRKVAVVMAVLALAGCENEVEGVHKQVAEHLQNPKTAKFANVRFDQQGIICGQVRGKDDAGVFVPYRSYVAIKQAAGDYQLIIADQGSNLAIREKCGGADLQRAADAAADKPAPQGWDVEIVQGANMGALSDMTARLIEKQIPSSVVYRNGKPVVLLGPYPDKAQAEAQQADVMARLGTDSIVIQHDAPR
ncbi:SPOR domain-containing protein [Pseudomonas sp. NPDC087612]|uniref:SPOR domain-containing protein n=1 Tax=Pseudomonas TaxID=286 RepID=UPI000883E18B|nr:MULTISPECIES: SPOR domain-containing protein [unclassified Pseudomonas]QVM98563.1 SPOR domain-containing protein [Pseudomonas sp. SORT22]UVL59892.1 SPOR domain-containing protein [Pseudomonas sp. B21-032]UVM54108.1 SPOR domain-containing protein [Pseudomonas sp. B21-012]SDQ57976.1 Sporulation related domain-containing protein [Pseudomonas sp. UC 17F4]